MNVRVSEDKLTYALKCARISVCTFLCIRARVRGWLWAEEERKATRAIINKASPTMGN